MELGAMVEEELGLFDGQELGVTVGLLDGGAFIGDQLGNHDGNLIWPTVYCESGADEGFHLAFYEGAGKRSPSRQVMDLMFCC